MIAVFGVAPSPYSANPAYTFLVSVYTYTIDVFWFTAVGIGLLYLRLGPGTGWAHISQFNPTVSTTAAFIFVTGNLFPLICIWIPDSTAKYLSRTSNQVSWFAAPTLGISIVAVGVAYWGGFWMYIKRKESREGKSLEVERMPFIEETSDGGRVQVFEAISLQWKVRRRR
jgi:hypothetical protein